MTGTVTVTVHRHAVHPKYRKRYRISKKYLVDTKDFKDLHEGDEVIIGECKPISKNKYFKVIEVIKQAARVSELSEEEGLNTAMNRLGREELKEVEAVVTSVAGEAGADVRAIEGRIDA